MIRSCSYRAAAFAAALSLATGCADDSPNVGNDPSTDPGRRDGAVVERDAGEGPTLDSSAEPPDSSGDATGSEPNAAPPDAAAPQPSDASSGEDVSVPPEPPADDVLFEADHVLPITLTLALGDWNLIRSEGRSLNEVYSYCPDSAFDFTMVPARAQIGDRVLKQVGLRKKGFIGSLTVQRPALRIDIDEYVPGQTLSGAKTLTLNNSVQDASYTHQCMAYALFSAAGVPAPRCAFAEVIVNGTNLGIYVHVEAIKKPFLLRHFGDDSGNLYEGGGMTDFRADMLVNFEKKTNEDQPLSQQITALSEVLARPSDDIVADVEALVDLDQFMRFWAAESLISHWDGYSGDLNNFYVYVHPVTGKLVFIPWGTDSAFERNHPYLTEQGRPKSVFAWSRLPRRLYAIEQTRERFRATLRGLLETHWNEAAMLAEVDRIAALLGAGASSGELEAQRRFIRERRADLLAELDGPAPAWTIDERPTLACQPERNTPVSGTFRATWADLSSLAVAAENSLSVVLDGARSEWNGVLASAGIDSDGVPTIQVLAPLPDGRFAAARFMLGVLPLAPGVVPLHGFETYGAIVRGVSEDSYAMDGFVGAGTISFDQVPAAEGDIIAGRFDAQLVTLEPALAVQYSRP